MDINDIKKNSFELPVDYNGNAAQLLWLVGRTISVSGETFKAESSVVRLCNAGDEVASIKVSEPNSELEDTGMPILGGTSETFACTVGEIYEVTGTLSVTFLRDRRIKNGPHVVPEQPTDAKIVLIEGPERLGGPACGYTIEDNGLLISGIVDYDFRYPSGNKINFLVGVKPEDLEKNPNLTVKVSLFDKKIKTYNKGDFKEGQLYVELNFQSIEDQFGILLDWGTRGIPQQFFFVRCGSLVNLGI